MLSLDDATSFLLEATATGRHQTQGDAAEARALAEALGQLALALEMAAATGADGSRRFSQTINKKSVI